MCADKEFWTICLISDYNANFIAYNDETFKRECVILYNIRFKVRLQQKLFHVVNANYEVDDGCSKVYKSLDAYRVFEVSLLLQLLPL